MNFSVFDAFTPPYPGTPFWGGGWGVGGVSGGGVKTSVRILGAVCGFGPRSRATFVLYIDPLTHGGGPGSELRVPLVAPLYGPLLVRPFSGWIRLFNDTCKISESDFFGNPSVAPGMGLGDDLVTIRVLEHPWGPT